MRFTAEELALAKQVDLCRVAEHLGYTVKRIGQYHTLKEMDSIRIYDRSHWCRFSRRHDKGENGGSQIDFLRVFAGLDVKEAVFWLLDFAGYHRNENTGRIQNAIPHQKKEEKKKPFVLPEPAGSNAYLYRYLEHERMIARPVIDFFVGRRITTTLSLSGLTGRACRSLPVCGASLTGMEKGSSVTWQGMTNGTVSICIMGKAER